MKPIWGMMLGLALAGCTQAISYVASEYGSTQRVDYVEPATQEVFWIFPRRDIGKLMVSINPNRAGQRGLARGSTLGVAGHEPLESLYRAVILSYLSSLGLNCTITSAKMVLDPQYEMTFDCK